MSNYEPAEVWPPVVFIRAEMDALGWTEATLAHAMSISYDEVHLLLNGSEIDKVTAKRLSAAFGTSATYWLNLQQQFYDSLYRELNNQEGQ